MKIFVGSSGEGKKDNRFLSLCAWVEEQDHECVPWDRPGLFPPGGNTWESLREVAMQVDAAILLFSPDDSVNYRKSNVMQARDNVHLEYGLFSGILGLGNAIIVDFGGGRTPTDLAGLTTIRYAKNKDAHAHRELDMWMARLVAPLQRAEPIQSTGPHPFYSSGKESLFRTGTELLSAAVDRVTLVARTPVVLMGPRPYQARGKKFSYELEQFELYRKIVELAVSTGGPTVLCVADASAVADEIEKVGKYLQRTVAEHSDWLTEKADEAQDGEFALIMSQLPIGFGYLVCDDNFMIWTKDGSSDSVWITAENERVANALQYQAEVRAALPSDAQR